MFYQVNIIANYDRAIIPYLDMPTGTELERMEGTSTFKCITGLNKHTNPVGYYSRVLGTKDLDIDINELHKVLAANNLTAQLTIDETETSANWTFLHIANAAGEALAQIERNPVTDGELA